MSDATRPVSTPSHLELMRRQVDHHLVLFRRTWRPTFVAHTLLPVFFLLAMGLGLGGYVDRGPGDLGMDYVTFVAAGMIATNAMTMGVGESTYPIWVSFRFQPVFQARIATPLRPVDVLDGIAAYTAVRLVLACAVMLAVSACFGAVGSVAGGVGAVAAATLVGLAYAMPVSALAATIHEDTAFALLFRLGVIPMTLFSGAFFPVEQLPSGLQLVAWLTPVWHGVETVRMCTTDSVDVLPALGHVAYLLVWIVAGWLLARRQFARRLADGGST